MSSESGFPSGLPPVTIILLNWNSRHFLEAALRSILAQDYPDFSVWMVDNASTDDSMSFVRRRFPEVRLLPLEDNMGFAAGNNVALRVIETPVAVLVNPDIIADDGWLRALVSPFINDSKIGVTGSKIFYPGRERLQHAGGVIAPPQAMPDHYGHNEPDRGEYDAQRDVNYVSGSALGIRSQVLDEIGFLDEGYFLYFEEADFCKRARRAGYRVVYVADATLVHFESVLTEKWSPNYLRNFHTGRWRYLLKHYSADNLLSETLPAERVWLQQLGIVQRRAAALAYRATLDRLPEIVEARQRHGAPPFTDEGQRAVAAAVTELHTVAWRIPAAERPSLKDAAIVHPLPFSSSVPVLGPLIAAFRDLWSRIAAQPYVNLLQAQQNELNQRMAAILEEHEMAADREAAGIASLSHEIAQMRSQVAQLQQRCRLLNARLSNEEAISAADE